MEWNPDRDGNGRFVPGSGGRPLGAVNRAGRRMREAMEQSIELHFADALERVRRDDPATYLRLLLRAITTAKYDQGNHDEMTPEQLAYRLRDFARALAAAGYAPLPDSGDRSGIAALPNGHDAGSTEGCEDQ